MVTRKINHKAAVRAAVWDACAGKCHHCGCDLHPFRGFHLDHLVPLCAGGEDAIENIVGSCASCNQARGALGARGTPPSFPEMTGDELRRRRKALGLSQAELARRLDVPYQTVYKWETDRVKIERAVMMDLALKQLAQEMIAAIQSGERGQ